ncbi:MAG: methyltransferase [Prevotella sp.]|nr:methyltransferase [Prevotella sp.]MBQ8702713.1 methyltransferase [Prevotella sp.]
MPKDSFRFKQFLVCQERCAMKVGTDGVLLGAWVNVGQHVLDVGTGTGLIALMVAQRFPEAYITAIDIDGSAYAQAFENVANSPFSDRVGVKHVALQQFEDSEKFDAIVSNPPFFEPALKTQSGSRLLSPREIARHSDTLSYSELCRNASRLLVENGEFSVIVPFDYRSDMDMEAAIVGLFPSRVCAVRTSDRKPVRRYLLAYKKHPVAVEQSELVIGSTEYRSLVEDFYL